MATRSDPRAMHVSARRQSRTGLIPGAWSKQRISGAMDLAQGAKKGIHHCPNPAPGGGRVAITFGLSERLVLGFLSTARRLQTVRLSI